MRALRRQHRDAHDLLLYLLTCPEGNFIGLAPVPLAHVAGDICWPEARVRRALEILDAERLACYDFEAQVAYLPLVLEWQPIETERQAKGAIRRLDALPATVLIERFTQALRSSHPPARGKAREVLLAHFGATSDAPSDAIHDGIETPSEPLSNGIRTQALALAPAQAQALAPALALSSPPLDGLRPLSAEERRKVQSWLGTISRTSSDRRDQTTKEALTALKQVLKLPEEDVRRIMHDEARHLQETGVER